MESKIFSNGVSKNTFILGLLALGLLGGCASKQAITSTPPESSERQITDASKPTVPTDSKSKPERQEPDPRALAALQLTRQGEILIKQKRPDDAIRTLERAVGLDPTHGPNYYYLCEAWLQKGDMVQAKEFNRLAVLYLKGNPDWKRRLKAQNRRLDAF